MEEFRQFDPHEVEIWKSGEGCAVVDEMDYKTLLLLYDDSRNYSQRCADALTVALHLIGGWREAIAILEDHTSDLVKLKNMTAALDQIDEWVPNAKMAVEGI